MKINDKRNTIRKHPTKKPPTRTLKQITDIAIHHSLTTSGSSEAFANYHVGNNGWSVMGYTYVINRDGSIDWCADYTVVTPHVGNHNRYSLGICMVGDFRTQIPTKEQYEALLWLIDHVQGKLPNKCKIVGHSEYSDYTWKACPVIDMNKVRSDVANYNKPKPVQSQQSQYPSANVTFNNKTISAINVDSQVHIWSREIAGLLNIPVDFVNGQVVLDGKFLPREDVKLIDSRGYVHVRRIAELLGLKVGWEANTKTVVLSK